MKEKREDTQFNARKQRVRRMIRVLKKLFPHAGMALHSNTDWELLIAVMLSAQCTDERVNRVTPALFRAYPSLEDYARAPLEELEAYIKPTGFYHAKARNIKATAQMLLKEFGGKLPRTVAELSRLPGVGRKTAHVVLGNVYGVVEGIAVDTHVRRFAIRFDLSDHTDARRIEYDLMRIVPKRYWFQITYWLIEYGRNICPARRHPCDDHPLTKIYPQAAHRWPRAK